MENFFVVLIRIVMALMCVLIAVFSVAVASLVWLGYQLITCFLPKPKPPMHALTTNPKVKPTQLEYHLIEVAQALARKNYRLAMIDSYLDDVIDEWKTTRQKYAHAKTRVSHVVSMNVRPRVECRNELDQVVFTIS